MRRQAPAIESFLDFLLHHARVKSGSGYEPYHFAGREALRPIVERLDQILASGETDASLAICGGAQFGKTVLMLNLLAYLVAVKFRNVGYYLPDDDLVSGLVDGKLRPDVLDQIPWLARLIAVGKTLNASGRAVNRKGAFLCTDGTRTALAFMRGLGKIPTSFSMDVVVQDEKDDLPDEHARFLAGRMTASNLRLTLLIGTQRYHGAGQNLAFTEGTQHIGLLACTGEFAAIAVDSPRPPGAGRGEDRIDDVADINEPRRPAAVAGAPRAPGSCAPDPCAARPGYQENAASLMATQGCGQRINPETAWPGVCRLVLEGLPSNEWPRLAVEGHFSGSRRPPGDGLGDSHENPSAPESNSVVAAARRAAVTPGAPVSEPVARRSTATTELIPFSPGQKYALCCPACGALLDRDHPQWHAQAPDREKLRRWSYRLSQLLIPAIDLEQIVAAWQLAIRDPEHMTVFCTNRLALPKSTTQTLTPGVLEAARGDYTLEVRSLKEEGRSTEFCRPSSFSLHTSSFARYAGLDMGDQCWFVARAVEAKPPHNVRLLWIEPIAAERVRQRVPELFRQLHLTALCVDAGPLRDLSRELVWMLNDRVDSPSVVAGAGPAPVGANAPISVPAETEMRRFASHPRSASAGYHWHEPTQRWRHVRAMAVEFTQREGAGLRHKYAQTQDGRAYPLLAANRDETIERIVQELLPPGSGDARLVENPDGTATQAQAQRFLLPAKTDATREVLDLYERHLLAGARQEREGNALRYLDKCENHFLLATAYAALAELIAPIAGEPQYVVPMIRPVPRSHPQNRSLMG